MPIEATPLEQVVVAVAEKCTGEPTEPLLVGAVTDTPELPLTVMVMGVVAEPPQ
jgi:hypothetical protein